MLIIDDGFAIRYEYEDEKKPAPWDYSHLLENEPLPFGTPKPTEPTPAKPRKAKREDFQMQLF